MAATESNDPKAKPAEQQENETPKKTSPIALILAIVVPLILAVGLVYFVVYPWYRGEQPDKTNGAGQSENKETEKKPLGQLFTLKGLTINPKDSNGRRFAVLEVVMEFENAEQAELLKTYEPVIKDHFLRYFRERTVNEMANIAIMDSSKKVLANIANRVMGDEIVSNIYFTQFVLQ